MGYIDCFIRFNLHVINDEKESKWTIKLLRHHLVKKEKGIFKRTITRRNLTLSDIIFITTWF